MIDRLVHPVPPPTAQTTVVKRYTHSAAGPDGKEATKVASAADLVPHPDRKGIVPGTLRLMENIN